MSKNSRTKLGFQIAENFHAILSVHENEKGELTINPAVAEKYSEIEFGNLNADKKITAQHYTVHNSPQFDDENVLNHTLDYFDKTKTNTRIYTRAFKKTNLLCPLFLARGQDFSNERYISRKKETYTYVTLNDYNPKAATVYYMVVVSNSGFRFNGEYPDLNVVTIDFQKYSLSLLWSYGLVPSHSTGSKSHFLTQIELESQLKEGFFKDEIVNLYRVIRQVQHLNFLLFLQRIFPDQANELQLLKGIGFKKSPNASVDCEDKRAIAINLSYEYFALGRKADSGGRTDEALKMFETSAAIFKEQGQVFGYAESLNSLGTIYQTTGFPTKSIACYEQSLGIYKEHNLFFHLARTYLNISIVYRDLGEFSTAIKLATEALSISASQGFVSLQADANRELGVLQKNLYHLDKALDFLNTALGLYKGDHDPIGEAFCLGNMGLIRGLEGNYSESLKLHDEALRIFTSQGDNWGIGNEIANLGNMNCALGNFDLGLTQLHIALEKHQATGYEFGIATDLKLIGGHSLNNGDHDKGKQYLEKSRNLFLKIGNQNAANHITNILREICSQ
jgi:tetratricopeptide (TPR) repeat protein